MRLNNKILNTMRAVLVAVLTGWAGSAYADVDLSQQPLLISTGVEPNVMLLMDNSGSMNNVIHADGYDPSTSYSGPFGGRADVKGPRDSDGRVCIQTWYGSCNSGTYLYVPAPLGEDTRYSDNYLNYLHDTYGDGANLRGGEIPDQTRIGVARSVAKNIVDNNSKIRFGVMKLDPSDDYDGGVVMAACGADHSDVKDEIDALTGETNTPLAEAYYEMTRYFRGLDSAYHDGVSYTSPVEYRCQRSFSVVLTDGFPTLDTKFPTDDPHDVANTADLPDWDGRSPSTSAGDYPDFPQYSDGFNPDGTSYDEGYTLYLDDLALFASDLDLRTGGDFDDSDFRKQTLDTFTVGFATDQQMLEDAAEYGNGEYYTANDHDQLTEKLQSIMSEIVSRTSSSASIAANSTQLNTGTMLFQSRYDSGSWSGDLLAYEVESNGGVGDLVWSASDELPTPDKRKLFTRVGGSGSLFAWDKVDSHFSSEDVFKYIRGDRANEVSNGGALRTRTSVLGDLVHSNPVFAHDQDFGYGRGHSDYSTFLTQKKSRTPAVYVGGNDGMLHAFHAETGTELFGYIPSSLLGELEDLADPKYVHEYFVDGSPWVGDAKLGGSWASVLVGTLGNGGRSVFALDVTTPSTFGTDDVLWEFSHAELGLGVSEAQIIQMEDGTWAAVFGNGYNADSGTAQLFIVKLADGSVIKRLDTGVGGDNGLGTPIAVDTDGNNRADTVYAGDLKGNLWKFEDASADGQWAIAYGDASGWEPLFTAEDDSNTVQPITSRPEVANHPDGGVMVVFGTGRFLGASDVSTSNTQSLYGVRDNGSTLGGRNELVEHEVQAQKTAKGHEVRTTTAGEVNYASKDGWYLDLPDSGERVTSPPLIRHGRVIFTTLVPTTDPCAYGGTSWIMELDYVNGARPDRPVFDLNDDGAFNDDDTVDTAYDDNAVPPSGLGSEVGVTETPAVIGAGQVEYKYLSGSSGKIGRMTERGSGELGRASWRQVQ